MKIVALKYYKNGEMQEAFAMGGSMAPEKIDMSRRYPSSLQNYLIDTGREVILIDTGLPKETPDFKKDPDAKLYVGEKIQSFPEALEGAGYKPADIDKIVVTHKHPDHTGELRMFPDAKIYISRTDADALKLSGTTYCPQWITRMGRTITLTGVRKLPILWLCCRHRGTRKEIRSPFWNMTENSGCSREISPIQTKH